MENHKFIMLMADECINEVLLTVKKGQDDMIKAQFKMNENKINALMNDIQSIIYNYMTYTTEIKNELDTYLIVHKVKESEIKAIRAVQQFDEGYLNNLKNRKPEYVHNVMIEMIESFIYTHDENLKQMKREKTYIDEELKKQKEGNDIIIIQKLRDLKNQAWEKFAQTKEEINKEPLHVQTEREQELEILYRKTEMTKERLSQYIDKIQQEEEIKRYNGFIDFGC
jgi:hypothetical protein